MERDETPDISTGKTRYYDRGVYRISCTGLVGALIYTAWYLGGNKPHCIAVCRQGSDEERHEAAKQACRQHWQQRKGVDHGSSTEKAGG